MLGFSLYARMSDAVFENPNHLLNHSTHADQVSYELNPGEFQNLHHCCHCTLITLRSS